VEASSGRPSAARRVEPLLLALSLLTLVTGLVDAACYLGLGRVFTANMTGNVVLLAFGATGAQGLPVLAPTVSLVVFLVGAAAGGRLASSLVGPAGAEVPAPVRRRWVTITLLLELLPVAVAGVVALGLPVGGGGARRYVVIGLLAAGLGLQNAATPNCRCCDFTAPRLIVPDIDGTGRSSGPAAALRCRLGAHGPPSLVRAAGVRIRRWPAALEGILTSAAHHHENRRPLWDAGRVVDVTDARLSAVAGSR
jgi:hypothetical protein